MKKSSVLRNGRGLLLSLVLLLATGEDGLMKGILLLPLLLPLLLDDGDGVGAAAATGTP